MRYEVLPEVRLRSLAAGDAAVLAEWGTDRVFCEHAGWSPDTALADRREWWATTITQPPPGLLRLAACVSGEVVGYVDLHGSEPDRRELGYVVGGRDRWGRGLGSLVARAGIVYGFEVLRLQTIWAEAVDANTASVAILRRVGMRETGLGAETTFLGVRSRYRRFELSEAEFAARST